MATTLLRESDEVGNPLSEVVEVRRRFLRSVNLEQDFHSPDPLDGYLPTPAGIGALEQIAEGVRKPHARAFSITGAYGSGKFAFALFAAKVLAVDGDDARTYIAQRIDSVQVAVRLEVTCFLIARQHSYRMGTLRSFEVRHCRPGKSQNDFGVSLPTQV
jgi:hypothetical protein